MKNVICYLTFILCLSFQTAYSQIKDGDYRFANNEVTLDLTITGGGLVISSARVTYSNTKKSSIGKGKYATDNNNISWYEFQTSDCNYDFDVLNDLLILSQHECKKGQQKMQFHLQKKGPEWTGTYKNSKGGVLIINNYKDDEGFDYKFEYGGTSICNSFKLSGTAILESYSMTAYDKNSPKVTFELKGNKIILLPFADGADIKCLNNLDFDFIKK